MAITQTYLGIGKGITVDGSVLFDIYGKMFDPTVPSFPSGWSSATVHNSATSFNLLGFQPGLEVCVSLIMFKTSSTTSGPLECKLEQWDGSSWQEGFTLDYGYIDIEVGYEYAYYCRVGIDPDEIRPEYTQYRFHRIVDGSDFYKTFTISNLSFDTNPHPAGYLWIEGNNLCYVPPCIFSGSSKTGYKHIIDYDSGYSGANAGTDKAGFIWIPNSSSDHHIYYVTANGYVHRTKNSYDWSGGSYYAGSSYKGYVRMTPSTAGWIEQEGYNYLCYIDGGGYKRRLGVGEI